MSFEIRDAIAGSADDASAIRYLIQSLAATLGEESPITDAYVRSYLATAGNIVLLAHERGKEAPLGLITCSTRPNLYHAGESALIEELVVAEEARGRGVGGDLLHQLLSRLDARGCAEVSVTTMPGNQRTIRFYKAHGLTDEAVFLEKHFERR